MNHLYGVFLCRFLCMIQKYDSADNRKDQEGDERHNNVGQDHSGP